MKASYHGHMFEVDSIIGKDGMEYPAQDVVLIEPDWSSFRREAAKDAMCSIIHSDFKRIDLSIEQFIDGATQLAIQFADALIEKLKQE